MIRFELIEKYRGSFFGFLWSFFNPVIMLLVYTFVFGFVFQAKFGIRPDDKYDFAIMLFTGLIVFNLFSEIALRAPRLILYNPHYVKKAIFPLETLPFVAMGNALFHFVINLLVLLVFVGIHQHNFHFSVVYLPVLLLPLVLGLLGMAWYLASMGVYFRDITPTVGIIVTFMIFVSPVFYPISAVPEPFRNIIRLNPLNFFIEQSRLVIIGGHAPDWGKIFVFFVAGLAITFFGFKWFNKTKKGFSDAV